MRICLFCDRLMVGSVIHVNAGSLPEPRLAEIYSGTTLLTSRLQQQGVRVTTLLQCSAAADAAAYFAAAQTAPGPPATRPLLVVSQPAQLPFSLRLALEHVALTSPSDVVFVSVSDSSSAASQAAALGCGAIEQIAARTATPMQVQAWGLQAVACHAALRQVPPPLLVAYVMKQSRQLALCQQGMLPLLAQQPAAAEAAGAGAAGASTAAEHGSSGSDNNGTGSSSSSGSSVSFFPLDLGSSLQHQLRRCHMVLQKLTDCLQPISGSGGSGAVAPFTPEAAALLAALEQQQQQEQGPADGEVAAGVPVCLVDPAAALGPIMDRALLGQYLQATALAMRQLAIPMRAPTSLLLNECSAAATPRQLAAAGVSLPCILKPRAACGVAEAHQMTFVLHESGFAELEVPLPAVAQEYVDHGGVVCKVYVAGRQVYWTQRKSTPDLQQLAAQLAADPDADIPASISFDSLKSLPTTLPELQRSQQVQAQAQAQQGDAAEVATGDIQGLSGQDFMRQATFEAVAAALRQRLGLTLFGFDLVFDRSTGEQVIVDVNYFPSFKGIPEAPAALQAALRERYAAHLAAHWAAAAVATVQQQPIF